MRGEILIEGGNDDSDAEFDTIDSIVINLYLYQFDEMNMNTSTLIVTAIF